MSTGTPPISDPQPEPEPAAPAPDVGEPPEPTWARELRQTLEALPGKLKATISGQDKRDIAEWVHGLFEKSGAFEKHEPEPDAEPGDNDPEKPEPPADPDASPEKKTIAERMGFPKW